MGSEGHSDVLIVGAGPTGCAAAITLARAGASVTIVDRTHFPRDKTCGDALSNDGFALLQALGASAAVQDAPHALVCRSAAVLPDGSRIERAYERPGYIVPRRHLDDGLRRALNATGVEVLQGVTVTQLRREGARVTGAMGPEWSWSAKWVIAADGHGSVGLAALGQGLPRGRYLAVSATQYMRGVSFPHGAATADHFFEHDLPYGYGWIFPQVDGVANVGVYVRADAYARAGRKLGVLLDAFIARHETRFSHAQRVGKVRVWSLPLAPRPQPITAPGLLLAGDAAGFVDPLSGEGIYQALYTGKLAGEVVALALRDTRPAAALLRRYEAECGRVIGRASRKKALVQGAMAFLVEQGLYRHKAVRAMLTFGFQRRALEMTKS